MENLKKICYVTNALSVLTTMFGVLYYHSEMQNKHFQLQELNREVMIIM